MHPTSTKIDIGTNRERSWFKADPTLPSDKRSKGS